MLRRGTRLRAKLWLAALVAMSMPAAQAGTAAGAGNIVTETAAPIAAATIAPRTGRRMAGRLPGKPAYVWLWYADGNVPPEPGQYCQGFRPPAFKCNYAASTADCQRQVQNYLDVWYADFNVVFTFTRPPSGDYYAMIITSAFPACQETLSQSATEAGVAPFNCNDNPGQTGYVFECGASAHACATIIAHEHGHLVGLEHTSSKTDIMNTSVLTTAAGFDNQSNATVDAYCQPKQNSYDEMLKALGAWPGGSKPGPFSTVAANADAGTPDTHADSASDVSTATDPGSDIPDGDVIVVGSEDALTRPVIPRADAAVSQSTSHGCSVGVGAGGGNRQTAGGLPLLALLLGWRRRNRPR